MSTEEEIKNLISFLTSYFSRVYIAKREASFRRQVGVLGYLGPSLLRKNTLQA